MDLRDLAYFEKIAEFGHLGRAADDVGRTKPALSKCIRRLEEAIGAPLFERDGRRIKLTAIGDVLHRQAREMRISMQHITAELAGFVKGDVGHVRIGAGPTIAEVLLPDMLSGMLAAIPGVTAEIQVDIGETLRAALSEKRLDLIVSTVLATDKARFFVEELHNDEVVVVAAPNHPLAGHHVPLTALVDCKWILPDRTAATRQWLDDAFESRGLPKPQIQIETNSLHVMPTVLRSGEILGFTPKPNLAPGGIASSLQEVFCAETVMTRQLGILQRAGIQPAPIVSRVARAIAESLSVLN